MAVGHGTRRGLSLETATLKPAHPLQTSHLWMLVHPPLSCREGEHPLLHFGCLPAHHLGTAKAGQAPGPTPAACWGCKKGVPSKAGGLGHSSPPRCQGKRCHPPLAPAPRPPAVWHACSQASEGGKQAGGGCTPLPPLPPTAGARGGQGLPQKPAPSPVHPGVHNAGCWWEPWGPSIPACHHGNSSITPLTGATSPRRCTPYLLATVA